MRSLHEATRNEDEGNEYSIRQLHVNIAMHYVV